MEIKKLTRLSMLLALSVILGLLENMIPFFSGIIPGLKLGLANIVVLFVLYTFSSKDAFFLSILRVILMGLISTGLFSIRFFLSLGGALLSFVVMALSKKYTKLSVIGTSVLGSIAHSVGQILVAILLIKQGLMIYYLPWLLLFSIPTGIVVGYMSKYFIDYFEKRLKINF